MSFIKIKSYAKINMALNIVGKKDSLHKIESIVAFASLHDEIFIKKINSRNNIINFTGKFSKNIGKNNTISKLLKLLENNNLLKDKKFKIRVNKKIPNKAGFGGGSMNAASILNFFVKKKIIKTSKNKLFAISKTIGSDVILGLNPTYSILNSKNEIRYFYNCKKIHLLIVKPNFGCSTKQIYLKVKTYNKKKFNHPSRKMFDINYLRFTNNDLENIVLKRYPKLRSIKLFLENLPKTVFVRMTGSGSSLVAYYLSKERCDNAKKQFNSKYRNYWCVTSKTI